MPVVLIPHTNPLISLLTLCDALNSNPSIPTNQTSTASAAKAQTKTKHSEGRSLRICRGSIFSSCAQTSGEEFPSGLDQC